MSNLRISRMDRQREDAVVLTLSGEVDCYSSPRLKQEIADCLNAGRVQLVVDICETEYLDATGLGMLLGGLKRAKERDGDLRIVCGNQRILRIFEITGLNTIFDVYPAAAAALAAIPGGG